MKLYARADGEITAIRMSPDEEAAWPVPPGGAVSVLEFDPATNPGILPAYNEDHNGHRLIAGVLTRDGVPYVIVADGENEAVRKQAAQTVANLTTYLGLANPTNAQNAAALKTVARAVRYLIRREFGVA